MKINGTRFSQLDKVFLGVFLSTSPQMIAKWQDYILSTNSDNLTFDTFLLSVSNENAPKKYRTMGKQLKKRLPKIIGLWQSIAPQITFDKWCLECYERHNQITIK